MSPLKKKHEYAYKITHMLIGCASTSSTYMFFSTGNIYFFQKVAHLGLKEPPCSANSLLRWQRYPLYDLVFLLFFFLFALFTFTCISFSLDPWWTCPFLSDAVGMWGYWFLFFFNHQNKNRFFFIIQGTLSKTSVFCVFWACPKPTLFKNILTFPCFFKTL